MPVQLAFKVGVDERNRGCAAGRGGREALHGAARTAQVFVRGIHHQVGVGGVVNRRNLTVPNADIFVNDFDHGRKTVGGARGGGHNCVLAWVVQVLVHAHDDIKHIADFDRCVAY